MRRMFDIILHVIFILSLAWLDFYLPSYDTVTITGTEVKRVDKDGPVSSINPADGQVKDVYFIYAEVKKLSGSKVSVYRNEDTGWAWPPYFKFDSADKQALAQSYVQSKREVRVEHYGWRIQLLSAFPNVLDIRDANGSNSLFFLTLKSFVITLWSVLYASGYLSLYVRRRAKRILKECSANG